MTDLQLLTSAWDIEPSIAAGCAGLIGVYGWATKGKLSREAVSWYGGVMLLFLVLVSPLDVLGDTYLFSAHMLQHLALALVVPPLLLRGVPRDLAQRIVAVRWIGEVEKFLRKPGIAWPIGIGAMALWHTPLLFNAALASEPLHIAQHLCFLVTGSIFWWPIFSPFQEQRLEPVPNAAAYLITACLACTMIGILLTFSEPGIYPAYLHPRDTAGALSLVRDEWGISAKADHQTGGLLMWVLGCAIYLLNTMLMFGRWYGEEGESAVTHPATVEAS